MKRDSSWVTLRRLLSYLRPYAWPWFAGALACMVIYSATSGAVPYLVRSLIDDIFAARDEYMLRILPAGIFAVFSLRALVNFGQAYLGEYVGQHIVFDLRQALEDKVQHLPLSYLDRAATGSIVARVNSDVLLVREALTQGAAGMIRDATTVVVLVVVAFYLDVALAVIAFIVLPAVIGPLQKLSRKMRRLSHRGLATLGGLSALLQESIQGARVVKAFGMEGYERGRFETENDRLLQLHLRAAKIKAMTAPMMELVTAVGIAALLYYGGGSVMDGTRTTGSFMAFLACAVLIYEPFKKMVRTNNVVQTGLGAAERVFELLDVASEAPDREDAVEMAAVAEGLAFEDVHFSYGREEVLHGVDLVIPVGHVVALVGPSGSGKTTMADLIPRFYDVDGGRVAIDGVDVRGIGLESLRGLISVVNQETFLFNDTIRNNIAYGGAAESEEAVAAAARAANAHQFISELPEGYDTVVGEMGVQLSGGQRQRLAIARAVLKDAPILILDEATSALDSESERLVQGAVERLMEGRTTLVIAHRLSTIRRSNAIAVIDQGRVVETGSHAELLAASSRYRRLYEMQFEDGPDRPSERAASA